MSRFGRGIQRQGVVPKVRWMQQTGRKLMLLEGEGTTDAFDPPCSYKREPNGDLLVTDQFGDTYRYAQDYILRQARRASRG